MCQLERRAHRRNESQFATWLASFAAGFAICLSGCTTIIDPAAPPASLSTTSTPVFSLGSGTYSTAQTIAITDATPGAQIYYTTNGTTPTAGSTLYTGQVSVSSTETLEAIAVAGGYSNSAVAIAIYTITVVPVAATPTFAPPAGTYSGPQAIAISDAMPGAVIYYTLNGSAPTANSTLYTGPISISSTVTIKAIAIDAGYTNSAVASAAYTIAATPGEWTWMGGASSVNSTGNRGAVGVPGQLYLPSSRNLSEAWTDHGGNLWLLGGESYQPSQGNLELNDLWEYQIPGGEWTWWSGSSSNNATGIYGVQGTPATGNAPGARSGGASWVDGQGNLWLFGGFNPVVPTTPMYDTWFNDLWEYSIATGQWTWVGGSNQPNVAGSYGTLGVAASGNVPGGRFGAVSWTDSSGSLWLFGGEGFDSTGTVHMLNDLWKFNPATKLWCWVSGGKIGDSDGNYGTQGVAGATNVPGGRYGAYSWTDANGNLWLFGGEGINLSGLSVTNWYNDLWMFNPATSQWTWVTGSNTFSAPGVYGTLGLEAAGNVPGARYFGAQWIDRSGNLWLFGGAGFDASRTFNWLNDLWRFNPATNRWTWMSGSSRAGAGGTYGVLRTPAATNVPGARINPAGWVDASGDFWLFDGLGNDATDTAGELNDLWRYQP